MNKFITVFLITGFIVCIFCQNAVAGQDWKAEFDDICWRSNEAAILTKEEIKSLIEKSDNLKLTIETLDESTKKVYLRRLQMCRDMFVFTLESKEQSEK